MNLPIIYRFVSLVTLPLSAALYVPPVQAQAGNPQPAILTASNASGRVVVFPSANALPTTQNLIPLPSFGLPQGVSYFGSDKALVTDIFKNSIYVVQISTATLLDTIYT